MASGETDGHKVIIVGAPKVGKTSLIHRYLFNEFSYDVPQMTEEEKKVVSVKAGQVCLVIRDMTDKTDLVTRQYYTDTKAVIFVYDVTRQETLFEAESWIKDLRIYLNEQISNGLPVLFVGNMIDQVDRDQQDYNDLVESDEGQEDRNRRAEYVTLKQVRTITDREGFLRPMECSAFTGEGVNLVFQKIASVLAGQNITKKKWCTLF